MTKKDFRILVVDDEEIVRDVISAILSTAGYAVITAKDGLDAIRLLEMEEVNLVITDLRMPGADGIEVLKKAVRTSADIAVVILTGYETIDTTLEAMKEGAFDYLTKPIRGQEIIFVADHAFNRAILLQENRELAKQLRETFQDVELLKAVIDKGNPEMMTLWIERIERLRSVNVLSEDESAVLRERLIKQLGQRGNINDR